jgi:hypothetical protein
MNSEGWQKRFRDVYVRGVAAWQAGRRSPKKMFDDEDARFLASIGCTRQELFDFVDDVQNCGEPDFDTVLEVQAIRRNYLLNVMGGEPSSRVASMDELPAKGDAVDGIEWLPRIIEKARLKLRGEMPSDLMFGCGGDRPFLRRMKMTLPEFLNLVWESGPDDRRIIDAVKRAAGLA